MELEQFWRSLDLVCEEEASSEDKDDFDNTSSDFSFSSLPMSALEKESRKERRR